MQPIFLGFDCSTQSFTATAVDADLNLFKQYDLNFQSVFGAEFSLTNGVHSGTLQPMTPEVLADLGANDNGVVTQPTLLFVAALDRLLDNMKQVTADLEAPELPFF